MTNSPSNLETYSFSRLTTFHQCKYQYWLNYITEDKPEKVGSGYTENGTFCHALLEGYERGEYAVYELADLYEEGFMENVPSSFPVIRGVYQGDKCYEDCYNFFCSFDGIPSKYEIIGAEDHFVEVVEPEDDAPFCLQGYIDLALTEKETGNLILWDWKSTANMTKKTLLEKEPQLYLYSLRMKRKYDRFPDELIFYSFRADKAYPIKFDEKKFDKYMEWMVDTVKEIRNCTEWDKNPQFFFCNNLCDFRESCDMGAEVEV